MLFTLLVFSVAQAAPKPETYYLGADADLIINKSSDQEIRFELNGVNSFNGHTSVLAGVASRKGDLWEYRDAADKTCVLQLKSENASAVGVTLKDCHGDWLSEGTYKLRDKDCGPAFDRRNKEVGALSRAKKYSQALKKVESLAKDCLETQDENGQAEMYSDLAYLALKTGDKKRCRAEVQKGIQVIGAPGGMKELQESFEYYADEDKSCKQATQSGCWIYEERIKIYKRLDHNRKLCAK